MEFGERGCLAIAKFSPFQYKNPSIFKFILFDILKHILEKSPSQEEILWNIIRPLL